MHIRWYGHSCFLVQEAGHSVLVDPLPGAVPSRPGLIFAYPPVRDVSPDLVLVTHDHWDHSGFAPFEGTARVIREPGHHAWGGLAVEAIIADHDTEEGRRRGHVLLMVWQQGPWRLCHLSDLGQPDLTHEQRAAIGSPHVLFVPVGGGPTIDGPVAARLVRQLKPRHVLPMHYRTPAINFLDTVDSFLAAVERDAEIRHTPGPEVVLEHQAPDGTTVYVLPAPVRAGHGDGSG